MKNYGLDRLLEDIGLTFENGMPEDFDATLAYALYSINTKENAHRNVAMFMKYYFSEASMLEIAKSNGISNTRVKQIVLRTLRKLKNKPYSKMLKLGLNAYYEEIIKLQKKISFECGFSAGLDDYKSADEKRLDILNKTTLDQTEMSTRLYVALRRAGYETIGSVISAGAEEIKKVSNLGIKGATELIELLVTRFGEKREDWV